MDELYGCDRDIYDPTFFAQLEAEGQGMPKVVLDYEIDF